MIPVFPIVYFGSIAYFKELAKYSEVFIETKENFPKQSYRNRCEIVGSNGILSLSIPTKRNNGSKTPIDEVILSKEENWKKRHWRSITSAYQSAPFFDHYGMEVEELLFGEDINFLTFNENILKRMIQWLDLDIKISRTIEFASIKENDYRSFIAEKNNFETKNTSPYIQVFPADESFSLSLSMLDAIMCEGPLARNLIL
jgi:hypothetical protein